MEEHLPKVHAKLVEEFRPLFGLDSKTLTSHPFFHLKQENDFTHLACSDPNAEGTYEIEYTLKNGEQGEFVTCPKKGGVQLHLVNKEATKENIEKDNLRKSERDAKQFARFKEKLAADEEKTKQQLQLAETKLEVLNKKEETLKKKIELSRENQEEVRLKRKRTIYTLEQKLALIEKQHNLTMMRAAQRMENAKEAAIERAKVKQMQYEQALQREQEKTKRAAIWLQRAEAGKEKE